MLQVEMQAALTKKVESLTGDIRSGLREKNVRHSGITRNAQQIEILFRDTPTLDAAKALIADQFTDLQVSSAPDGTQYKLTASIKPEAARRVQDQAVKQNITTLHNRIMNRRGGAGDSATGIGSHRGSATGRAGHCQGQGHPGSHGDA
jgi:preprotein translocase subunit SecD